MTSDLASKLGRAMSRRGSAVMEFIFIALSLVFLGAGIWSVARSVQVNLTYQPVSAQVIGVEGGEDTGTVQITYQYEAAGRKFKGVRNAKEGDTDYRELLKFKTGDTLTVYLNPSRPEESVSSNKPRAEGLGFVMFMLPFLAVGLEKRLFGSTGFWLVNARHPNGRHNPLPGRWLFLVFAILCTGGCFAYIELCQVVRWPWNLLAGVAYLLALPLVMRAVARLVRRKAMRQAPGEGAAPQAPDAPLASPPAPQAAMPSLGKALAVAAGVTLFWCGITGTFTGIVAYSFYKHWQARMHFAQTEGVVVASEVKTHSGDSSDTYSPEIRYRYVVDGRTYVSKRYAYALGSVDDSRFAERAVAEHPPGTRAPVYYNPADPREAVLQLAVPSIHYVLLLFLQPFVLVGLAMIIWTAGLPHRHGRLRAFLSQEFRTPWRIPGWGVLYEEPDGMKIQGQPTLVSALAIAALLYGLACIAGGFVLVLGPGVADSTSALVSKMFLIAAGAAALGLMIGVLRPNRAAAVTIDPYRRVLRVVSRRWNVEARFEDIKDWRIMTLYGGTVVNNRPVPTYLLYAATADGQEVPVHLFSVNTPTMTQGLLPTAHAVQAAFAHLTNHPAVAEPVADSWPPPAAPKDPIQAAQAIGKLVRGRMRFNDLR